MMLHLSRPTLAYLWLGRSPTLMHNIVTILPLNLWFHHRAFLLICFVFPLAFLIWSVSCKDDQEHPCYKLKNNLNCYNELPSESAESLKYDFNQLNLYQRVNMGGTTSKLARITQFFTIGFIVYFTVCIFENTGKNI